MKNSKSKNVCRTLERVKTAGILRRQRMISRMNKLIEAFEKTVTLLSKNKDLSFSIFNNIYSILLDFSIVLENEGMKIDDIVKKESELNSKITTKQSEKSPDFDFDKNNTQETQFLQKNSTITKKTFEKAAERKSGKSINEIFLKDENSDKQEQLYKNQKPGKEKVGLKSDSEIQKSKESQTNPIHVPTAETNKPTVTSNNQISLRQSFSRMIQDEASLKCPLKSDSWPFLNIQIDPGVEKPIEVNGDKPKLREDMKDSFKLELRKNSFNTDIKYYVPLLSLLQFIDYFFIEKQKHDLADISENNNSSATAQDFLFNRLLGMYGATRKFIDATIALTGSTRMYAENEPKVSLFYRVE